MKKWLRATLLGLIVFGIIFLAVNFFFRFSQPRIPLAAGSFITANPLDLSQIKSISQFRSCEGHNYSGRNAQGGEETYRTMKHYLESTDQLAQTSQQVKIFAPFDGRISQIAKDSRGSQVYLSPASGANGWDFIFFHVDLLPKFNKKGTEIVSGDHLGFANIVNAANFDIALRNFGLGRQLNDSPFNYMTEAVLSQFSAVGITLENIIISKEKRDSSPCQLAPGQSGRDAFYARSGIGKSWINLEPE